MSPSSLKRTGGTFMLGEYHRRAALSLLGIAMLVMGAILILQLVSTPVVRGSDFWNLYTGDSSYPPLIRLIFVPVNALPVQAAYVLWSLLSIACYVACLLMVLLSLDVYLPVHGYLLVSGCLACWYPFIAHVALGQVSLLLTLLIYGGWVSLQDDRPWIGGVLWGVACALKLFPGLLVLYLLPRRQWKALVGLLSAALSGFVVPFLLLSHSSACSTIAKIISNGREYAAYPINVSLHGVISRAFLENRWFEPLVAAPALAVIAQIVLSCGVVFWLMKQLRCGPDSTQGDTVAFSSVCIAMILLSPISWQHIFPLLLFPLGHLLKRVQGLGGVLRIVAIGLCLSVSLPDIQLARLVMSRYAPYRPPWYSALWLSIPTLGMVGLGWTLTRQHCWILSWGKGGPR